MSADVRVHCGDALDLLRKEPDESVQCCVTSPPYYGTRDYHVEGQVGLERTPEQYVARLTEIFAEVRRVLDKRGTLWLVLGDCHNAWNGNRGTSSRYAGDRVRLQEPPFPSGYGLMAPDLKQKDLIGIPWAVAFSLRGQGWYLRSDICWAKTNPMPESVVDRPTRSHETIFLFSRSTRYYYDRAAGSEPAKSAHWPGIGPKHAAARHRNEKYIDQENHATRNLRDVWEMASARSHGAHVAVFPDELARRCVTIGCPPGGVVLDPFCGSGTTLAVAVASGRRAVGYDLNPDYCAMSQARVSAEGGELN